MTVGVDGVVEGRRILETQGTPTFVGAKIKEGAVKELGVVLGVKESQKKSGINQI
jgi:hypothetical protein